MSIVIAHAAKNPSVTDTHIDLLAKGWAVLHLSVETPERVPPWDAILLTSANDSQSKLYEMQIESARRRGLIGPRTLVRVMPDPQGKRIGSGGATLHVLRTFKTLLHDQDLGQLKVLLIHAGGDSKRLPWASVFGKPFVPFPLLADPDHGVPTLFDHILAVTAPLAATMPGPGIVTMSGDVLPIFSPLSIPFPQDAGLVITTPVSLDVAERHGVIVANQDGHVIHLLQKTSAERLVRAGALVAGGAALLDTGIYAFLGGCYEALVDLSMSDPNPVDSLIESDQSCSLYEEVAGAMVPKLATWLRDRPLGNHLLAAIGSFPLIQHCDPQMAFVHFGSTSEVLHHLSASWSGRLPKRVLAETGSSVDPSALVYVSQLGQGTIVGAKSLVYGSQLGDHIRIGNRCIVVHVEAGYEPFILPDNCCLWQVPVSQNEGLEVVTVCCGVDDNPKAPFRNATFCNKHFSRWLQEHQVSIEDLWIPGEDRTLWTARLFPAGDNGLELTGWILSSTPASEMLQDWKDGERYSLQSLQSAFDVMNMVERYENIRTDLALHAMGQAAYVGLERNVIGLASQLNEAATGEHVRVLATQMSEEQESQLSSVPQSRRIQVKADLLKVCGETEESENFAALAFQSVQEQVARSVRSHVPEPVKDIPQGRALIVELPLRFDFAGGWSDTPPYCLERPARVLNMAITLDNQLPVGADALALDAPRWELTLEDLGKKRTIEDPSELQVDIDPRDPFTLLKVALILTGYGSSQGITQGVRLRTWSRAPKGSGLGASSILGAATVSVLQQLADRPSDPHTLSDLVLTLEQRMTTGGGWQDQVGGLFPGIKCTSTAPVTPIDLVVDPVPLLPETLHELHQRFVLVYTGIDRLAKNILQIVVGRYLRRDRQLLSAIEELVELADESRKALARGDVDELGRIIAEVWNVHQHLDPHSSTLEVDALFHGVRDLMCGAKLAGAGGGGFAGILAKDAQAADLIRDKLGSWGRGVRVYPWSLWTEEPLTAEQ